MPAKREDTTSHHMSTSAGHPGPRPESDVRRPAARDGDSYDVAVVGGGIVGLAVAWRARQRGLSVLVLERGELGAGTSRVAAGMLAPVAEADAGERALLELGLRSARGWATFAAQLPQVSGPDVRYPPCGTPVVARRRARGRAP